MYELQCHNQREHIDFVVNMTCIAGFELLANVFLSQLRTIPNCHVQSCKVVCSIVDLPPYKLICKPLDSNPCFQAFIGTLAQLITKKKILKLTLNVTLRLSSKAVVPIQLELFNMIVVNKKHQQNMLFLWTLHYIIVDSFNNIISEVLDDLDKKLFELVDNIHDALFSLLVEKILY